MSDINSVRQENKFGRLGSLPYNKQTKLKIAHRDVSVTFQGGNYNENQSQYRSS